MLFSEHPEWGQALLQWQNLFQLERMPQAILLSQESGVSLNEFGLLCTQSLLCEAPKQGLGCGECQACRLFESKSHPDFYHIGDDNSGTNIEAIRTLLSALQQSSHQAGCQVVLLKDCDTYSAAVGNALLKTLEEPIGQVVFILLAKRRNLVMKTVMSRCVKIHLSSTDETPSEMHLMAKELFEHPEKQPFLPTELQDWVVAQPQEALIVLYNVIKARLQIALIRDPDDAASTLHTGVLKRTMAFIDVLSSANKQCMLPGINKLLLIESLFYRWQKLSSEWR